MAVPDTDTWLARTRARLRARPLFSRILANFGWLSADRVLRLAVGLLVGVWLARYLGPETFGQYSFAFALAALFGAFSKLGLDGVLVRELVRAPQRQQELLASALVLRLAGGVLAAAGAMLCGRFFRSGEAAIQLLVSVAAVALVFQALDVFEHWFQSQLRSRYAVAAKTSVFLLMAGARVGLIVGGASVVVFAGAAVLEVLLGGIALLAAYRLAGQGFERWRVTWSAVRGLLRPALPLIFAGLAVSLYMRIDQVMIARMLGDHAVGLYSAATRLTEATYFLPGALVASVLPAVVSLRTSSEPQFVDRMQRVFDLMVVAGVSLALPLSLFSGAVVRVLFGEPFADSAGVLAIHAWASVFVYLGMASSSYLLARDLTMVSLTRTMLGAVVNVVLNLLLIPEYGIRGAALATLISACVATFAVFLDARSRPAGVMMLRAFDPIGVFRRRAAL
ncbi:MAG TPA: flippase [Burkholderiales bacterium]|nr:flippase [Burkholderiales bacterium]